MGAIPKALIMKSTKFQDGITYNKTNRRGVPGSKQLANEIGGDETFKDLLSKVSKYQNCFLVQVQVLTF